MLWGTNCLDALQTEVAREHTYHSFLIPTPVLKWCAYVLWHTSYYRTKRKNKSSKVRQMMFVSWRRPAILLSVTLILLKELIIWEAANSALKRRKQIKGKRSKWPRQKCRLCVPQLYSFKTVCRLVEAAVFPTAPRSGKGSCPSCFHCQHLFQVRCLT